MYWVTMTDTFMSNWGCARGKKNKLVFVCDTYEEAEIVADNARNRTDQKYISICTKRPRYSKTRYFVQFKYKNECEAWYSRGYFKTRRGVK